MDTELLFVRCFPKQKRCTDGTARTVYYLANITGDLEEVASSLLGHENSIVYEACADFREKYGHIFPVGSITVWDFVEAMLRWADKMIWFSFLIRSHESMFNDLLYKFLPDWDERFGNASNSSLWILLRIGSKIWPIHVIHNQFGHGWAGFWADNELRSGFKLVFGCERSWIFDVVVLMTHLEPLYFHWSTTTHEFQESSLMPFMIDDLGTPSKCSVVFGKQFRDFFRYADADAHEAVSHRHFSDDLSEIVDNTLNDLEVSKCVAIEHAVEVSRSNLGMIAPCYYMGYTKIELFSSSLITETNMKGLLEILASSLEYALLPICAREEELIWKLINHQSQLDGDTEHVGERFYGFVISTFHERIGYDVIDGDNMGVGENVSLQVTSERDFDGRTEWGLLIHLGCFPVSLRHLILLEKYPPPTELFEQELLCVSALKDLSYEALYPEFRHFNAVYVAPIEVLCKEWHSEWRTKFGDGAGMKVVELTGETPTHLEPLDRCQLIVSTPEKCDALCCGWKQWKHS
ncbi:hypothetical protein RHMOL_Rhmol11G0085100 [Rhododendron molle]|uniref:Uncharacterized protein n=1 Tax=Rhododendron molle TaxID=49168 RepID=A0ACC0LRL5_RHOML|nr:hypothetical protein RHMOL_Rhmol11G0085100 [Rhododendron molle]